MTNLALLKSLMIGYGLDRAAVAAHLGYSIHLVHSWFTGRRAIDPADLDLLHYIVAVRPLLRGRQPIQAMTLSNEWDLLKTQPMEVKKRGIGALLGIAKICELKGDAEIKLDGIQQICAAWNKNRNPE